ncbi:hypothetical protein F5B20DRAFT_12788 [Whalleya microplaca]|nr:hypothetical protein F5B20DRAFT_12788 [Whalleya microplaca]
MSPQNTSRPYYYLTLPYPCLPFHVFVHFFFLCNALPVALKIPPTFSQRQAAPRPFFHKTLSHLWSFFLFPIIFGSCLVRSLTFGLDQGPAIYLVLHLYPSHPPLPPLVQILAGTSSASLIQTRKKHRLLLPGTLVSSQALFPRGVAFATNAVW